MLHRTALHSFMFCITILFSISILRAQSVDSSLPELPGDAGDAPALIGEAYNFENEGDEVTYAARYGNYLYMAANSPTERLVIYDISNPLSPVFLNDNLAVQNISKVFVYNGYLYITTHSWQSTNPTIHVLDLSNPTAPALVGQYRPGHWIVQLGFQGNYMFVFYQDGIRVVDITDPSTPQTESSYTWGINGVTPVRMSLPAGDYLYYTFYNENTNSGSVHILDISDKSNVQEVADISTGSHHPGGIWADNTLMIYSSHKQSGSDYDAYLHAWDVANKANPTELQGDYQISDKGQSLGVNMVDGVLMASINTEMFPASAGGSDGDKVWAGAWDGATNSFVFGTEFETPQPGYLDVVMMDDEIARSAAGSADNSLLCDFFYLWLLSFNWESFDFTGSNATKLLKLGYRCIEQTTYRLTIVQQPPGASGVCSTDPAEGTHQYDEGEQVTVTATAGGSWLFSAWEGDGVKQGNSITVTMDSDKTVTVTYTEQPPGTFNLTTGVAPPSAQAECTMTPGDGAYEEGTQVELSAQPGEGWLFMEWQGNASGSDNPTTIVMDSDKDVVAFFQPTLDVEMTSPEKQISCPPYKNIGIELATVNLTAMGTDWLLNGIVFDVLTPFDLDVIPELIVDFEPYDGTVLRNGEGKIVQFVFSGVGADLPEGEITYAQLGLIFDYPSHLTDGHSPGPIPGLPVTLHVKTHKSLLTAEPKPEDARPGVVVSNEWYTSNEQIVADIYNTQPDDEGYETIREAIAAAANGETIVVCPGFYEESVTVDRSLTLRSAYDNEIRGHYDPIREKKKASKVATDFKRVFRTQLKPVDSQETTINCLADNITIEGFSFKDNISSVKPAISAEPGNGGSVANLVLRNNRLSEVAIGIKLAGAGVTNAHIYDNEFAIIEDGIFIDSLASGNVIGHENPDSANSFFRADYGVIIGKANGNQVLNNRIGITFNLAPEIIDIGVLVAEGRENIIAGNWFGRCTDAGVYLEDAHNNSIRENYFGRSPDNKIAPNTDAVELFESSNNLIDRNIFGNNGAHDILITGAGAFGNIITGNEIGAVTDEGSTFHSAADTSIHLKNGASNNTIGGVFPANRNILLGGDLDGIVLSGAGTTNNNIIGNEIGSLTPFGRYGIHVSDGAASNIISSNTIINCDSANIYIGQPGTGDRRPKKGPNSPLAATDANTISSNFLYDGVNGIVLEGRGVTNTAISSNSIYNMGASGISVFEAIGTKIGESDGGINYIGNSSNLTTMEGILLSSDQDTEIRNAVVGYILPKLDGGAGEIIPGGPANGIYAIETENLLVDNCRFANCHEDGIHLDTGMGLTITNSKFGIDLDDAGVASNTWNGIDLVYADSVTIGGAGAGNVISGNGKNGISIKSNYLEADINISHNLIGTTVDGSAVIGNGLNGIEIKGSTRVTIADNTLSGNDEGGLSADGLVSLFIHNNKFGTDVTGTIAVPNRGGDLYIDAQVDGLLHNLPGNGKPGKMKGEIHNNIFAGSSFPSFTLTNAFAWSIYGNIIGMDINQEKPLPNHFGVNLQNSSHIYFGGSLPSQRNFIVSNTAGGMVASSLNYSEIIGNFIGTNADYASGFGNGVNGLNISGCKHSVIADNKVYNNEMTGIQCSLLQDCTLLGNIVVGNGGPGISMIYSYNMVLANNRVKNNCSGIDIDRCGDSEKPILAIGNVVENNSCSTGFHLEGSSVELQRNTVTDDASDGVYAADGTSLVMRENNIYDNAGYAVNNADPGTQVDARGNYWGAGGEHFFGAVDASGVLQSMVTWSGGVVEEIVAAEAGTAGTLLFSFQSLSGTSSSIPIAVTEDLGWLTSASSGTVDTDGLQPGLFTAEYSVPEGTSDGTINEFIFTVTAEGEVLADTVTLIVYTPEIQELAVTPAWKVVNYGDSLALSAVGLDQYGQPMVVDPVWSADGGTIDTLGVFVADSTEADVTVSAVDQTSGLAGEALLLVRAAAPELAAIAVEPAEATIKTLDTLRFTAFGFDQFGQDHYTSVVWSAEGGVISEDGLFIADTLTGTFTVTASDVSGAITGTAEVTIQPRDPVAVEDEIVVTEYALYQNYPNPFNPSTTITYAIPEVSEVDVYVYNMLGELVRHYDEGVRAMGRYELLFDASHLASGIYFYRIKAGRFHEVKKMLLVK